MSKTCTIYLSCLGYCFKSSRVEEDGDDTLNTAPESTELHILNTTPAVRANTSSSTGYKKAISEAHMGDMRNKNGNHSELIQVHVHVCACMPSV